MNKYYYQETMVVNVEVYAKSKKEAEEIVGSAIQTAFEKMPALDSLDKAIRDNSFDTLEVKINKE